MHRIVEEAKQQPQQPTQQPQQVEELRVEVVEVKPEVKVVSKVIEVKPSEKPVEEKPTTLTEKAIGVSVEEMIKGGGEAGGKEEEKKEEGRGREGEVKVEEKPQKVIEVVVTTPTQQQQVTTPPTPPPPQPTQQPTPQPPTPSTPQVEVKRGEELSRLVEKPKVEVATPLPEPKPPTVEEKAGVEVKQPEVKLSREDFERDVEKFVFEKLAPKNELIKDELTQIVWSNLVAEATKRVKEACRDDYFKGKISIDVCAYDLLEKRQWREFKKWLTIEPRDKWARLLALAVSQRDIDLYISLLKFAKQYNWDQVQIIYRWIVRKGEKFQVTEQTALLVKKVSYATGIPEDVIVDLILHYALEPFKDMTDIEIRENFFKVLGERLGIRVKQAS